MGIILCYQKHIKIYYGYTQATITNHNILQVDFKHLTSFEVLVVLSKFEDKLTLVFMVILVRHGQSLSTSATPA